MALLGMRDVNLGFGGPLLLDGVNLQIDQGERICLLGRNGVGKSTLMRLINGELEPDRGEIIRQQGLSTALLPQEVPRAFAESVFDEVVQGLGPGGELLAEYHAISHELARDDSRALHERLDRVHRAIDAEGGWQAHRQVEDVIARMELDPEVEVKTLSAGRKRRVLLAKALVRRPDILLLDEPTNHLDIEAIDWLEDFLLKHDGSLVFVTHDRMFLRKLSTRILEIDRGLLTSWSCGHASYLVRKEAALEAEQTQQALFDKKLAQEEAWIRQGIKARRTRNEGRVRALKKMRETRRERRERPGTVKARVQDAERSGRMVIRADKMTFGYGESTLIDNLSTTVMRGDRVGIIGPNGSGKTTLIGLLLKQLQPRGGSVRHGTHLEVAYFDQLHARLDDEQTVQHNVSPGTDTLEIEGQSRHIIGYLGDFLFPPDRARSLVKYLSGGERNRLLLARLFSKPSNLLVMDEPTNDLDVETLELLEELLLDYAGTLLLVSHDREFLNNVVTSTLVFEGEARVKEYAGGYDDWLTQRGLEPAEQPAANPKPKPKPVRTRSESSRRLTYKEQLELKALPERIEQLESQRDEWHQTMADPAFYQQSGEAIAAATARFNSLESELQDTYARWEELEERAG